MLHMLKMYAIYIYIGQNIIIHTRTPTLAQNEQGQACT